MTYKVEFRMTTSDPHWWFSGKRDNKLDALLLASKLFRRNLRARIVEVETDKVIADDYFINDMFTV